MMTIDDYDGQMIFGEPWGLKLPDICLTGEKKPHPRKLVTTGDRTRARCVTGAHVTACPTEVDSPTSKIKGSWHKKYILWVSKKTATILIKFRGFIVQLKPYDNDSINFSRKNSWNWNFYFLIFCPSPNVAPNPIDKSSSNSISIS